MGDNDPLPGDTIRTRPGVVRAGLLKKDIEYFRQVEVLRTRVMAILRSDACRKIHFRVDNISIQPAMYLYIATSVMNKTVGVEIGYDKSEYPIPQDYAAAYEPVNNILYFRSFDVSLGPSGEGSIVHESTHAIVDATFGGQGIPPVGVASPPILNVSDELSAYLAQTLYALYLGRDNLYVDNPFNQLLWGLATKIKDHQDDDPGRGFLCTPDDTAKLKTMLASAYRNHNQNAWIDGLHD